MKVLAAKDVRELDSLACQQGISTLSLMDHAAMALYHQIQAITTAQGTNVGILCGPENNGGDGFALALHLQQDSRYQVEVYCMCEMAQMSEDERTYAKSCMQEGIQIHTTFPKAFWGKDILVDCLFGTGLCRNIEGSYADVIHALNDSDAMVLSCDIPSGLDADHGTVLGCCVQADVTVSFAAGKMGLFFHEGMTHCGKVILADIGIPASLIDEKAGIAILDAAMIKARLPRRTSDSHKGSYGKVLLIGGSYGMSGAVILAAKAALRCGVGTCTIMGDERSLSAIGAALPEVMYLPYPKEQDQQYIQDLFRQYDAIAIGNGLGRTEFASWLVEQVWHSEIPCVLDGDALFLLPQLQCTPTRYAKTLFTPHPKELSYLTGIDLQKIIKNPLEALFCLLKRYPGCCAAAKGTRTLISDGKSYGLNIAGNNGLATGGSGDVLCGMVLGFLAQKAEGYDALACGVYLHACCGDALLAYESTYSILPSDLLQILPSVLKEVLEA